MIISMFIYVGPKAAFVIPGTRRQTPSSACSEEDDNSSNESSSIIVKHVRVA